MKIEIRNFGPISYQTIDLSKDLYLIYGKNNLGKSYGITLVYLALKHLLSIDIVPFPMLLKYLSNEDNIFNISNESVTIKNQINNFLKKVLTPFFIKNFESSIVATYSSLGNLQNRYTDNKLSIKFITPMVDILLEIKNSHLRITDLNIKLDIEPRGVAVNRNCKFDDDRRLIKFYYINGNTNSYNDHLRQIGIKIFENFYRDATQGIESAHYLPASRSGLYQALSAFGQIIAELSKRRSFLKQRIELPSIPEHLSDYFINLSEISNLNIHQDGRFEDIAREIENRILKGKVTFDSETKKMNYTPDNTKLILDLSSTSSMVSELSPIVTYLRHIVSRPHRRKLFKGNKDILKPLIFIEEPESHLHPSIQVNIMKIFSELVKKGVKLIITTHSNYIFNTTNNLIINKDIDYKTFCAQHVIEDANGSIVENTQLDQFGMDDNNFLPETESLFEEKIKILNGINNAF